MFAKKKMQFTDYPLMVQLSEILRKLDDPVESVRMILDPDHSKELKHKIKHDKDRPVDANEGIFRVIYWEMDEMKRRKFRTKDVYAENGVDAAWKIESIGDNISKIKKNEIGITGVECIAIPNSKVRQIRETYPEIEQTGIISVFAEGERLRIIAELEVFREEPEKCNLDAFIFGDMENNKVE